MSKRNWGIRGGLLLVLALAGAYQFYAMRRPLAPQLVSTDDTIRNMALTKLPKLSEQSKSQTVDALTKYQSDPNPQTRRYALYSLRQLGMPKPEVISFAIKSLVDTDAPLREEALAVLFRSGDAVIPQLVDVLRTQEGPAVDASVKVLQKLEVRAVPALTDFIKENPEKGLWAAVKILNQMGPAAKEATPALVGLLDSKDMNIRIESAEALTGLGILNGSAAPALSKDLMVAKESFSDPMAQRPRLAKLLEKLDPRRRELIDLGFDLKQKNPVVRYRAAYIISEQKPPNIGTMPMLVEALKDADVHVSARAVSALTLMGIQATERVKKVAHPRLKAAITRAQAANIEGFEPIAASALQQLQ